MSQNIAERLQELIGESHEAELALLSGDPVAIISAIKNLEGFVL